MNTIDLASPKSSKLDDALAAASAVTTKRTYRGRCGCSCGCNGKYIEAPAPHVVARVCEDIRKMISDGATLYISDDESVTRFRHVWAEDDSRNRVVAIYYAPTTNGGAL